MKLVSKALFLLLLLIILLISVLSTVEIKTNKFNNLISRKVSETKNVNLKLIQLNLRLIQRIKFIWKLKSKNHL